MRDLDGGAENEQQSAKNPQGHPPGVSRALFGSRIVHFLKDSVTFFDRKAVWAGSKGVRLRGTRRLDELAGD